MNRTEKAVIVSDFAGKTNGVPFLVIAEIRGTKVSEVNQLRRDLEKNGMAFRVMKNTLAKRAFKDVGVAGLEPHLKGMTGVFVSSPDAIASARVLKDLLKPIPTIKVRAGYFDSSVVPGDAVQTVAGLSTRPEMMAKLLGTLLEGPRQLVRALKAHEEALAAAAQPAAAEPAAAEPAVAAE